MTCGTPVKCPEVSTFRSLRTLLIQRQFLTYAIMNTRDHDDDAPKRNPPADPLAFGADEWLSAYYDGELSGEQREQRRAMLEAQPQLQERLNEFASISKLFCQLPAESLASNLPERVLRRAEQEMLIGGASVDTSAANGMGPNAVEPNPRTSIDTDRQPPSRTMARRFWWVPAALAAMLTGVMLVPTLRKPNFVARSIPTDSATSPTRPIDSEEKRSSLASPPHEPASAFSASEGAAADAPEVALSERADSDVGEFGQRTFGVLRDESRTEQERGGSNADTYAAERTESARVDGTAHGGRAQHIRNAADGLASELRILEIVMPVKSPSTTAARAPTRQRKAGQGLTADADDDLAERADDFQAGHIFSIEGTESEVRDWLGNFHEAGARVQWQTLDARPGEQIVKALQTPVDDMMPGEELEQETDEQPANLANEAIARAAPQVGASSLLAPGDGRDESASLQRGTPWDRRTSTISRRAVSQPLSKLFAQAEPNIAGPATFQNVIVVEPPNSSELAELARQNITFGEPTSLAEWADAPREQAVSESTTEYDDPTPKSRSDRSHEIATPTLASAKQLSHGQVQRFVWIHPSWDPSGSATRTNAALEGSKPATEKGEPAGPDSRMENELHESSE